ncbi:hypothetical protein [Nocardia terpenica]|uniref:Uncharacterized protein n=1 Tax=Nocardia terpenica TaxID=455432 RepID=A0A6G9ZDG2_9NOCA|nr:hypothetical protein [Nocardia terpenica]QIS23659.1 hypothetical protein F6W96_40705 [Nocardia terpenica]
MSDKFTITAMEHRPAGAANAGVAEMLNARRDTEIQSLTKDLYTIRPIGRWSEIRHGETLIWAFLDHRAARTYRDQLAAGSLSPSDIFRDGPRSPDLFTLYPELEKRTRDTGATSRSTALRMLSQRTTEYLASLGDPDQNSILLRQWVIDEHARAIERGAPLAARLTAILRCLDSAPAQPIAIIADLFHAILSDARQ